MKAAAKQDAADREPYPPLLALPMLALYAVATIGAAVVLVFGDDPMLNARVNAYIERQKQQSAKQHQEVLECLKLNDAIAARNARHNDHPPLKEIPCHVPGL